MERPNSTLVTDEPSEYFWVTAEGERWQYPDRAEHHASICCHTLGLNLPEFDEHLGRGNLFVRAMLHEWRQSLLEAFSEGNSREFKAWTMLMHTHLRLSAENDRLWKKLWLTKAGPAKGGSVGRRLPEYRVLLREFEQLLAEQEAAGQKINKTAAHKSLARKFNATAEAVRQALRRGKLRSPR